MTTVVKSKTPIVIPPAIRRQAGLKAGDRLEFRVSGKVITVLPKSDSADEYTAAQRQAINARLERADEDIQKGRTYGPFSSADEMILSMKSELKKSTQKNSTRKQLKPKG